MVKIPKQDLLAEFKELAAKRVKAGKLNPAGGKDRGSQYASHAFQAKFAEYGMHGSMSHLVDNPG